MKKFTFALIAALLCLALTAACGSTPGEPASSEPTSGSENYTRPDLMLQREAEKDGLVLRVSSDYQFKFAGEPFVLTASITNTTDADITYGVASGTPDMHLEIRVRIEPDFIDMDTYGKAMNAEYRYATLKAGETFTQTMHLLPGTASGGYWADLSTQDIDWYLAGEYKGTATFAWIPGTPEGFEGNTERLELEFPVILIEPLAPINPPPPATSGSDPGPQTAVENTTATSKPITTTSKPTTTAAPEPEPVILTPAQAIYPVGTREITVTWYSGADELMYFGEPFALQIWQGGAWPPAEPVNTLLFILPAYPLQPGESRDITYNIGHYYGPLEIGRYRVAATFFYEAEIPVRKSTPVHQVYAEFEVK